MRKIELNRKLGILIAIILAIGIVWIVEAMATIDQNTPWTTSASSGTVDDADYSIAGLTGPYAYVKSPTGQLDMRYNVVAIPGLEGGEGPYMNVRFRDTGTYSRVIVKLQEYNIYTGITQTRMTLDSNNYVASGSYQTKSVSSCSWSWSYDFNNNVYYIESSIIKTNSTANPGLAGVQLGWSIC